MINPVLWPLCELPILSYESDILVGRLLDKLSDCHWSIRILEFLAQAWSSDTRHPFMRPKSNNSIKSSLSEIRWYNGSKDSSSFILGSICPSRSRLRTTFFEALEITRRRHKQSIESCHGLDTISSWSFISILEHPEKELPYVQENEYTKIQEDRDRKARIALSKGKNRRKELAQQTIAQTATGTVDPTTSNTVANSCITKTLADLNIGAEKNVTYRYSVSGLSLILMLGSGCCPCRNVLENHTRYTRANLRRKASMRTASCFAAFIAIFTRNPLLVEVPPLSRKSLR